MFYSRQTRATNKEAPQQLLFGEPFLKEELFNFQLRISPDSFFQINTPAARRLYNKCLQLANIHEYSTILDLCCGAG